MDPRLICKLRDIDSNMLSKYNELTTINCYGIEAVYSIANDGSGAWFKDGFIRTLKDLFPNKKFNKCFEWCSGPGFIGYSILGSGITDKLVLGDVHEPALLEAKITAKNNNIEDKVSFYLSNNWDHIPLTEQFDLMVGDPPMFSFTHYQHEYWNFDSRLFLDVDWKIHEGFFKGARDHLTDDGSILILENSLGAGINTFKHMIEDSGLQIVDHFYQDKIPANLWYMHIKKL